MVASAGSRSGRAPVLAKYDVLDELGHGGMATVYRAHDKRLARDVAIKVLHPHLRENREIAHRFSVEARAVAKLRHKNIVEVFDVSSEEDNEQYLVVELVRGPTLRTLLQERGALPPEIAAALVLELLAGVAHAHAAGVVHRDVKPENVLIEHLVPTPAPSNRAPSLPPTSGGSPGERVAIKLTDFGIAKLLDAQGVTSTGQVLGSPAHMAPEQIEGGDVDGRADVFGLGVLLYECMVGHLPFLGNNPAQVLRRVLDGVYAPAERERPTVGKTWSQIIDRALARQPDGRYHDAGAMRDAIAAELARLGMGAPRTEMEAWLDDPEGWSKAHEKRLIERLCELGAVARKRSAAVAAAADYNRALAYAPNDPSLLRIVASMHRSEARRRLAKRIAPIILGACILGPGAYFIARAFKHPFVTPPTLEPSASVASVTPPASQRIPAVITVAMPPPTVPTHVVANPTVVPSVKTAPVIRTMTFALLKPDFGVHMTIDGAAVADPSLDGSFTLDEKQHQLVFTCTGDRCIPRTVTVPAGDKGDTLSIELALPPAKLAVDGDPTHYYGIEEFPQLQLNVGQDTEVPMTGGRPEKSVNVFDKLEPGKRQTITLTSGKREVVSFKGTR